MKKIILIDLDNTLLDFDLAEEMAISKVLEKYLIPNTKENRKLYSDTNLSYWKKLERKEVGRDELLLRRFVDFFHYFHREIDGKEVNDCYFSYLSQGGYPLPGSIQFLKECRKRNLKVVLVSNGVKRVQDPRINMSGIRPYLDSIYVSEEVGYNKPDIHFFDALLHDYPMNKKDMVLIGDSLTSDIQGGINLGVTTIWFNPHHETIKCPADYQIDHLMKFFNLDINK